MNSVNKNTEDIDSYLAGELTGTALEAFEVRLALEPELKHEVEATQKVIEGIEGYAFKKDLHVIHEQYAQKKKTIRLYYISAVAASALILMLSLFFIYTSDNYYNYFRPYPALVVVRGGENEITEKALVYYDHGDFSAALSEFEKMPDATYTEELKFFRALSYLGNKDPEEAIKLFENLHSIEYREQINWYLSLCYLLTSNDQQAKNLLMKIHKNEYEFKNAQQLISKIK